jgi:hypothetical protein
MVFLQSEGLYLVRTTPIQETENRRTVGFSVGELFLLFFQFLTSSWVLHIYIKVGKQIVVKCVTKVSFI